MRPKSAHKLSRTGEKVKVTPLNANEQTRRIQEAIARRAYEIFERRGGAAWHELEDWRQAESELVSPFCSGRMPLDGSLWVGTDAAMFKEGTIEIWIAPRQLTICGEPSVGKDCAALKERGVRPHGEIIYRVLDLPFDVDPSGVTGRINGPSLEILLRKEHPESEPKREVKAAAA